MTFESEEGAQVKHIVGLCRPIHTAHLHGKALYFWAHVGNGGVGVGTGLEIRGIMPHKIQ